MCLPASSQCGSGTWPRRRAPDSLFTLKAGGEPGGRCGCGCAVCAANACGAVAVRCGRHCIVSVVSRPVQLDDELVRAAELQPYVAFTDPLAARRGFNRAVKISMRLRGDSADDFPVLVTERTFTAPKRDESLQIRIYTPGNSYPPYAALLYLHGGAFVAGDLDTEHYRCLRFACDVGCIVVAVAYRLAPEHPFPAGLEDCYAALCWLAAEGQALGVDGRRIAVGGSSAGGTLAAALALLARDRGGPRLALQMLLYPALDDRLQTESMREFVATPAWTLADSKHMWSYYLGDLAKDAVPPYAAPARCEDLHGLSPAYLLTAELDALRDEGIDYAARLLRAGVPTELHQFAGTFHAFEMAAPNATLSRRAFAGQSEALGRAFRRT